MTAAKPQSYHDFHTFWNANSKQLARQYADKQHSFIPYLLPEIAVSLSGNEVLATLAQRLGPGVIQQALAPGSTIESPLAGTQNTQWIKEVNMVGINVRTIQSFWNVVKYALTLPASQSSIHLLPMWEPGVVSSLYGMASWQINPEFYSQELYHLVPQLNTVEKQLKAVVNLLHAMGKTVGMDVIPHTDRYSEIVLAQPQHFEWLRRQALDIVDHRANLHEEVQESIMSWLASNGSAHFGQTYPMKAADFYGEGISEQERLQILFGQSDAHQRRLDRRASLVDWLYRKGYEPVPATMAPPYRGLEVDPNPAARVIDYANRIWRDYRITRPEKMSRVFGPLTRYKFYERLNDNAEWAIDFSKPRQAVWEYFCTRYAAVQATYNLDFMRGDMSHVQMRPDGVPKERDAFYDPLGAVKGYVNKTKPYFGYFAESFLAPPGVMAYGDEVEHLEASFADSTLGDLQSAVVGEDIFMAEFDRYLQIANNSSVSPCFTMMTGDKDDPRFDKFYLHGNEARLFIGLFLPDLPSYQALGFCQRDVHVMPAPNEHYTKLFVFHLGEGPKATSGPYQWGKNGALFYRLHRIRLFAETYWSGVKDKKSEWFIAPDATAKQKIIAWTQADQADLLFVVNLGSDSSSVSPPMHDRTFALEGLFSSTDSRFEEEVEWGPTTPNISALAGGECRAYKIR